MGNPRSEISVDIAQLTRHAFARMDLACIKATPISDGILLTVGAVDVERPDVHGGYWFFRKTNDANKILDEMVTLEGMQWVARRRDDGVLIDVDVDRIDDVISECARWAWYVKVVTVAQIDAQIASVRQEIHRRIVRMQATSEMQELNRGYKAARLAPRADGETFPNLKNWLTREIERRVLLQETLAAITRSFDEAA